jgi:hypothetical protein
MTVTVCDTPDKIRFFQLCSMRGRLKLEMKGMRFKPVQGMTTATVVKKMFGLPRSCRNQKALDALEAEIEKMKKASQKALKELQEKP